MCVLTDLAADAGFIVRSSDTDCVVLTPARNIFQFRPGIANQIAIYPDCIEYQYDTMVETFFVETTTLLVNVRYVVEEENHAEDVFNYKQKERTVALKVAA